jgi:hypothetical protein
MDNQKDIVEMLREPMNILLAYDLTDAAADEIERLRAERDEARRLLKAVVDITLDNMVPDFTHPKHLCDFIHRPDIAMCKVCEDWTDAMVMCYPDDFQDKEDGK